ncbi:TPA: hypothetical protein EYP38_04510 [Candidatus Micrarchaeota archaeon]|nr:hypothetical protein [Candidatus Micrarchaeota archaeon]
MGTKLPWDPAWIVESLSDSTIYMAFYTIVHKLRSSGVDASRLTKEFWDFVMLGKGDAERVSESTGVPLQLLRELREEFTYWYPLDSRHSGKDLIPNHLTFFIFNHAGIFPEDLWPRQIVVNGFVLYEGKKMSKSLRNIIPLKEVIRRYGPDPVRLTLLAAAELGQDADFTDAAARGFEERLLRLLETVGKLREAGPVDGYAERAELSRAHLWLLNRINRRVRLVTELMDKLRMREAVHHVLFGVEDDVRRFASRWYGGRMDRALSDERAAAVLRYVYERVALMLAPFAPFTAQEMWSRLGHGTLVEEEGWPSVDERFVSDELELEEEYLEMLLSDIREIVELLGRRPSAIRVYVAPRSYYGLLVEASKALAEGVPLKDFVRRAVQRFRDRRLGAEVARRVYDLASRLTPELRVLVGKVVLDEARVVREASDYILTVVGGKEVAVVEVGEEEVVTVKGKRQVPLPLKPVIYIE